MKRHLPWALAASFVVIACAANEDLEFLGPSTENPNSSILGDASTPTEDSSTPATGGDSGVIDLNPAVCGDGKKAGTEECDDGNNASDDGCSDTCKTESSGPGDVCPGTAITLTGTGADTRKGSVSGQTSGTFQQYAGTCGGGTGKDSVYVITPDVTGLLTAKLTSTYDSILYARRTCGDDKTEAACNDAAGSAGGEQIKLAVTQGQPVYLFVDGYSGSAGTFKLDVEVATAFCGNGVAEAPEACDDGNTTNGDGCAADCTFESGGVLNDCPGQAVVVKANASGERKISFAGNTATLGSSTVSANSPCTASGPNAVYAIASDVDGRITAKLLPQFDNATLHSRSECDVSDTMSACSEATEPLQVLEITAPIRAGVPHYIVVDSTSNTSTTRGAFVLDVSVTSGTCGNHVFEGGEECDDGNTAAGDGCTPGCKLEPVPAASDFCPGVPLAVALQASGHYTGVVTSSTAPLDGQTRPKTSQGSCSTTSSITYKDAVFTVTSPINGTLEATVDAAFDSLILARTACDADAAAFDDLACSGSNSGKGIESIKVPIEAGKPLYLVVDAEADEEGRFELGVNISPAVCGNRIIDGGETCDDGGTASGDGCDSACQLEPATSHDTCANAEAITVTESATAPGTYVATVSSGTTNLSHNTSVGGTSLSCASTGRDAIYTVKAPIDGVLTVEVPTANFNVTLGARSNCSSTTTGTITCSNASSDEGNEEIAFSVQKDSIYYVVVDGNNADSFGTFTMNVSVRPPGCGDALVSGAEQCDDGNTVNGDGCSSTCTLEALAGIDTCPGYALTLAGTTGPRTGILTIDTKPLAADYAGTCGGNSRDGVVVVTPPVAGKLTARLTGIDYHAVLHARTTCNDPKTQPSSACDDDSTATNPIGSSRDITISNVVAGVPIYLFIDGWDGQSGLARLNVTVTP